jgi:hypothetical protein
LGVCHGQWLAQLEAGCKPGSTKRLFSTGSTDKLPGSPVCNLANQGCVWHNVGNRQEQKHIKQHQTNTMKKLLTLILSIAFASALSVSAADDSGKKELTPEQKKIEKAILDKYGDGNGKLDKEKRKNMTDEEKAQWYEIHPKKKKKDA